MSSKSNHETNTIMYHLCDVYFRPPLKKLLYIEVFVIMSIPGLYPEHVLCTLTLQYSLGMH